MTASSSADQPSTLETQALEDRLALASEVVRRAGQEARKAWQAGNLSVDVKGHQDFVTAIDRDTETLIRNELTKAFPGDLVLGEEFGGPESDGPLWVVDPIDGTANFIRGLADWAVSLALVEGTDLHLGIIYDGGRDCLYWARAGHGALCEGKAVSCADTNDLSQSLVMLGTNSQTPLDHHFSDHRKLNALGAAYRRHGSAATGLLMVADGRVDAYYERSLNAWDALGGLCIAQEAGAVVTAQNVNRFLRVAGPVLCTAPAIAAPIGDALASGLTASSVSKW